MKKPIFACLTAAGLLLATSLVHADDLTAQPTPSTTNPPTTTTPSTTPTTTTPTTTTPTTSTVTIQTTHGTDGVFLTDAQGHSLYMFEIDTAGKSNCTGACAKAWAPVTVADVHTMAMASGEANSTMVSTPVTRDDGTFQVTYNGMPLYTYVGDVKAGDTTGQGMESFGGHWYLVKPDGTKLMTSTNVGGH